MVQNCRESTAKWGYFIDEVYMKSCFLGVLDGQGRVYPPSSKSFDVAKHYWK